MSVILSIQNKKEFAELVKFLNKSQLKYIIPGDDHDFSAYDYFHFNMDDFDGVVHETLKSGLLTKDEIATTKFSEFIREYNPTPILVKATPAFKHFCGAEHCNKNGEITLETATEFVIKYASSRGLLDGNTIRLNGELQDALSTTATSLPLSLVLKQIGF